MAHEYVFIATLVFRAARLFRFLSPFRQFDELIRTAAGIWPLAKSAAAFVLAGLYVFAVLGMWLFGGALRREQKKVWHPGGSASYDPHSVPTNYYPLNFDTFLSSLVTLFDLMIVNNWYIIMDAYVRATTHWGGLFFVAFYVYQVLIVLNTVISFVIEAYMAVISEPEDAAGHDRWSPAVTALRHSSVQLPSGAGGVPLMQPLPTADSILASMFAADLQTCDRRLDR
eukprot:NODE_1909_length_869_cov_293.259756_g1331_i0.p2 GENE.NODE_1909_length_869_cov_293.259756_g1331_i0~~NODE_1909_length_869_cov_293.259756_g1331_i0.p2  ORF type:complete len:254 (-),score=94.25 NODE_1909_length_869_cov_293.259756_g1331_i0:108-788(-)